MTPRMSVEYMLAERTARSSGASRARVMMRIATLSSALGIAVMIVTLAVVSGFRHRIYGDLRGFGADVRVCDVRTLRGGEGEPMAVSEGFFERLRGCDGVAAVWAYAEAAGMAKNGDHVTGLSIKGVDGDCDLEWWRGRLVEGGMPAVGGATRTKELLVSRVTAAALRLTVGDKVEMLFMDGEGRPRRDRFVVSGLYDTGFEELDRATALTDIRNVQRIASPDNETISGYEIVAQRGADVTEVAAAVETAIEAAFYEDEDASVGSAAAVTLAERYPVVFDWMKTHDVNARVILAVMMAVVLFNMASAMLIMVLDRTGMIGVLKAMGMRNGAVRRIFLYRAAMLFVRGAAWGNAVGLALVALQAWLRPVRLDPEGYMLSELPVRVEVWWLVALNVGAVAVTVAVMTLPSMIVARISPESSLKYRQ